MPKVTLKVTFSGHSTRSRFLLNSGAEDLEVIIPEKLALKLGIPVKFSDVVDFGGPVPCSYSEVSVGVTRIGRRKTWNAVSFLTRSSTGLCLDF